MADPISIAGIVMSAVQLLDVGIRLYAEAREIYHVGSSAGNKDIQAMTSAFVQATRSLQDELSPLPLTSSNSQFPTTLTTKDDLKAYEQRILAVAQKCTEVGIDLENKLRSMGLDGKKGKLKSLRQAARNIWNKRSVDETAQVLESYKRELQIQATMYFEKRRARDAEKMLRQQSLGEISMIDALERLEKKVEQIPKKQRSVEQRILDALVFEGISARSDSVAIAHISTFRWIFEELVTTDHGEVDFVRWLESGNGMFWICGKAGSGKSTLVKHICGSGRTAEALEVWARQHYLMTAAFFAWTAGTIYEKTEHGLCRSLLHQLLSGRSELIQQVLPEQYQACENGSTISGDQISKQALRKALEKLAAFTDLERSETSAPARICIFIDGLDELTDDAAELATFLTGLSKTYLGFKIVLSGRPLNQFDSTFENTLQIRVQDLTEGDIRTYAENSITSNPGFYALDRNTFDRVQALLKALIQKADGVFLWVALVVKNLMSALEDGDTLDELFCILDELPNELEGLYRHMFAKMKPRHRLQAAQYLNLVERFHALESGQELSAFYLSLTREDFGTLAESRQDYSTRAMRAKRCQDLEKRVKARCCGLLEFHAHSTNQAEYIVHGSSEVRYLHKSVKEFLAMDGPRSLINQMIADTGFDADLQLVKAHLFEMTIAEWLRTEPHDQFQDSSMQSQWIHQVCSTSHKSFCWLVDRMYREWAFEGEPRSELLQIVVSAVRSAPPGIVERFFSNLGPADCSTFFFAVQAGLPNRVCFELKCSPKGNLPPSILPWLGLVYPSVWRPFSRSRNTYQSSVVRILVEHALDPSQMAKVSWTSTYRNPVKIADVAFEVGANRSEGVEPGWQTSLEDRLKVLKLLEDANLSGKAESGWKGTIEHGILINRNVVGSSLTLSELVGPEWQVADDVRLQIAKLLVEHGADLSEVAGDYTKLLSLPSSAKWECPIPRDHLEALVKLQHQVRRDKAKSLESRRIDPGLQPVNQIGDEDDWLVLDNAEIARAERECTMAEQDQKWKRISQFLPGLTLDDLQRWFPGR